MPIISSPRKILNAASIVEGHFKLPLGLSLREVADQVSKIEGEDKPDDFKSYLLEKERQIHSKRKAISKAALSESQSNLQQN